MTPNLSSSYTFISSRLLQGGLEKYEFGAANLTSDFLETDLKKPTSKIKNFLFNAIMNNKLIEKLQEFSVLMQQHKEQLSKRRAAAEWEDERDERNELPEEVENLETVELEKTSDAELAKLRQDQSKLNEYYNQLGNELYEQLKKQAESTEKVHEKMDKTFHEKANEAVTVMERQVETLKSGTPEQQKKAELLQEILEDFQESIGRDKIATQRLLQDVENIKDPVQATTVFNKHLTLQELKLNNLQNQLANLEVKDLNSLQEVLSTYGEDYIKEYAQVKIQIEQTQKILDKLNDAKESIKEINGKITDRENELSPFKPYQSPSTPSQPTEIPREQPSQGPTR